MSKRWALSLGVLLASLLVGEGLLSLSGGRTVRARLWPAVAVPRQAFDEERFAAAARTPGSYRAHPDPNVSYVLKAGAEFDFLGGRGRADALGLRERPAPAGGGAAAYDDPSALRVVVLGDSVAFGLGLDEEETLAARLESVLAGVRGPGARPIVCRTVALPGWNHRNAFSFLRDHFDALDPELVLYLPIGNDLSSSRQVDEAGRTNWANDLGEEDPWLVANSDFAFGIRSYLMRRAQAGEVRLTEEDLGPEALVADLSRESSRRYDEMAEAVLGLEGFLGSQGCRLALVHYERTPMIAILTERLLDRGFRGPLVPFLGTPLREDTLLVDGHPNARTVEALARVVACALLANGWLEGGADRPLEGPPPDLARRLAPELDAAGWAQLAGAARAEARARLGPVVDRSSGHGVLQVFGNMSPLGVVGTRLVAVLRGGGTSVRVALEPLEDRPDLYPLSVAVEIDGRAVGSIVLDADGPVEEVFPVERSDGHPLEVRLVPERWGVVQREHRALVASFRLRALEVLAEPVLRVAEGR
jgi:hypothetical protein